MDRHIMADLYDAINQNTRASGNWGKGGPPKIPSWPRPKPDQTPEEKKPVTVDQIFQHFTARR